MSAYNETLHFVCNICGQQNEFRGTMERETRSCAQCGSSVRLRALIHLLSREIFGAALTLPQFPVMKRIRILGMSDSQDYAERLAEKFDYTNTFFHKEPKLDITQLDDNDFGRFDVVLSSEVLEHAVAPVEDAFLNIQRLLKPRGVLIMTVPYSLDPDTTEHFADLKSYSVVALGDRMILVNRTAGGEVQIFEDLVFHGGDGSTLEMRRFSETGLRKVLRDAGFEHVEFAAQTYPEFGIVHPHPWSLPLVAGKQRFAPPPDAIGELAEHIHEQQRNRERLAKELDERDAALVMRGREIEDGQLQLAALQSLWDGAQADLAARTEWAQDLERQLQERTAWATELQAEARKNLEQMLALQAEFGVRTDWAMKLDAEIEEKNRRIVTLSSELDLARGELNRLQSSRWFRLRNLLR